MANIVSDASAGDPASGGSQAVPADRGGATPAARPPVIWPGVLIMAIYWSAEIVIARSDMVISAAFMTRMAIWLVVTLAFVIWWLTNRSVSWRDRLRPLGVAILSAVGCVLATRGSLDVLSAIFMGLALMWSAWIVWLLVSRKANERTRRIGLAATIVLVWAGLSLVRVEGVDGHMLPQVHWRWTPTGEQVYLSERARADDAPAEPVADAQPLVLADGDWPGFRGPGFLGAQVYGQIATNWSQSPPKRLWQRRVGPAWSSFVVVGDRLFTQEQRGDQEATVCLDAATGRDLWSHLDKVRFWDGQAGAGPRATPTFHDGRLYTYGATGILNCLDAATGKLAWTRDVAAETGAPLPMWGFSSSPLVAEDLVIVFAGGKDDQGLMAYRCGTGEPAWTAPTGPMSYSTAQLVTLAGQPQVLLLSDTGVIAVELVSGKQLWQFDASANGVWRVVQPRQMNDAQVLVGSEDLGLRLLDVAHEGDTWKASERWTSLAMRPAYNDYVVLDNVAYGFDKGIFCAIDLDTGKRLWKAGRYGFGQVLLLTEQKLLVVLTERGEVVLLSANPKKHEELGRFQAIEGKTWNHPVVVRGRLYVRNDTEMAAFDLAPAAE